MCTAVPNPTLGLNAMVFWCNIHSIHSKSLHFWVQNSPDMFSHTQKLYFQFSVYPKAYSLRSLSSSKVSHRQ